MANNAITNGQIKLGHVYCFRNKAYPKYALNVWSDKDYPQAKLSNVCLWEYDETDIAQKWVIKNSTPSYIQPLKGSSFNLYLDRYTGSGAGAGINAHLYTPSDTSLFDILTASQDSVKIKVANKKLYLTAYGGTNGNRTGKTAKSEGNVFFAANSNSPTQEWIPVEVEIPQKLIHPFETQYYTVGYKDEAPAYPVRYSYGPHYAVDMYAVGDATVKAMGNGVILGTKTFTSLGNVLAVRYDSVLNRNRKNIGSIVVRYCHLAKYIKTSGKVLRGEAIAVEGATGKGAKNAEGKDVVHLHMEFDTDTDYPLMTPTEGGGVDSTINPLDVLYKSEGQTVIPDCDPPANSSEFYNGLAWYNADKIRNTPIV